MQNRSFLQYVRVWREIRQNGNPGLDLTANFAGTALSNERTIPNFKILEYRHSTLNECVKLLDRFECILFEILATGVRIPVTQGA